MKNEDFPIITVNCKECGGWFIATRTDHGVDPDTMMSIGAAVAAGHDVRHVDEVEPGCRCGAQRDYLVPEINLFRPSKDSVTRFLTQIGESETMDIIESLPFYYEISSQIIMDTEDVDVDYHIAACFMGIDVSMVNVEKIEEFAKQL